MRNAFPGRETCAKRVGAALALATLACAIFAPTRTAFAYRDLADLPDLAGHPIELWPGGVVPLRIDARSIPGASFRSVESGVLLGASSWAAPACTTLSIDYQGVDGPNAPPGPHVLVRWEHTNWVEAGFPADATGATDLALEMGTDGVIRLVGATVTLNAYDYYWLPTTGEPGSDTRSIAAVVAHELGHALGLLHPCEPEPDPVAPVCSGVAGAEETTMYPLYAGPDQRRLSADDVAGICALYASTCAPSCGGGEVCTHGQCVPACAGQPCLYGDCVDGVCTRHCGPIGCPCAFQSDCRTGEICLSGACRAAGALPGDPCMDAAECATGVCQGGYCTEYCAVTCPHGFQCASGAPLCSPTLGVFGEECSGGEDCTSNVCLIVDQAEPGSCTRPCDSDDALCPTDTECTVVGDERVCAPVFDGGCSVSRNPSRSHFHVLAGVIVFAIALRPRRRRAS